MNKNTKSADKPRIKISSKPPVRQALPCGAMLW
jgi:hypothetical protein